MTPTDRLAGFGVDVEIGRFTQHTISALADKPTNDVGLDGDMRLFERVEPRSGLCGVTVDQRAVDVEKHRA